MIYLRYKTLFLLLLIFVMTCPVLSGCLKKEQKPSPQQTGQDEKRSPEELGKLQGEIQGIIEELDMVREEKEDAQRKQEESTTQAKPENKAEEVKQEGKEQEKQDPNKPATKQDPKMENKNPSPDEKNWKSIEKKTKNVHMQWNSLQPELVKTGVSKKPMDDFSSTLNNLTNYVQAKDLHNTLVQSNELYRLTADFMEPYGGKVPPDLKRLNYFVRDAKYSGTANQWERAKSSINNLKSHWSIVKAKTTKEQEQQASKTEFSINDLEKVVGESNLNLTKIKSDIVLDNIKKLEEGFEKAKSEGNQQK